MRFTNNLRKKFIEAINQTAIFKIWLMNLSIEYVFELPNSVPWPLPQGGAGNELLEIKFYTG